MAEKAAASAEVHEMEDTADWKKRVIEEPWKSSGGLKKGEEEEEEEAQEESRKEEVESEGEGTSWSEGDLYQEEEEAEEAEAALANSLRNEPPPDSALGKPDVSSSTDPSITTALPRHHPERERAGSHGSKMMKRLGMMKKVWNFEEGADGRMVKEGEDGSYIERHRDGTIMTIMPDGVLLIELPNGVVLEKYQDGRQVMTWQDGSYMEQHPDGLRVTVSADGVTSLEEGCQRASLDAMLSGVAA